MSCVLSQQGQLPAQIKPLFFSRHLSQILVGFQQLERDVIEDRYGLFVLPMQGERPGVRSGVVGTANRDDTYGRSLSGLRLQPTAAKTIATITSMHRSRRTIALPSGVPGTHSGKRCPIFSRFVCR